MKKYWIFGAALLFSACASVGPKNACGAGDKFIPSYFAHGERVAAFRVSGAAYGRQMDGILQIKKTGDEAYDVAVFALAGGIKLMQAVITPRGTEYSYIIKQADSSVVRAKAERLLNLILFAPQGPVSCKEKDGTLWLRYKKDGGVRYSYASGRPWPETAVLSKALGSAKLTYGQYAPYEIGEMPHYLFYEDGVLEAELILLTLKK